MKKSLITPFAMMLFVAFTFSLTLTGCGEEVQVNNEEGTMNPPVRNGEGTVFSAGNGSTRTTIDDNAVFAWEDGDKIFVDENNDGTFSLGSSEIEILPNGRANFYFRGKVLSGSSYNLIYKGSSPVDGAVVKIKSAQEQDGWNSSSHISEVGDCATATARPVPGSTGNYTFDLEHKAHYLILQPYKNAGITDDWKIVSVDIVDAEGGTLCGTYPISLAGLGANTGEEAKDTVTLSLKEAKSLPTAASSSLYAVIEPRTAAQGGRRLWVCYNIRPTGSGNGVEGGTFTVMKEISRAFDPNGVTKIQHELTATSYSTNLYYMWDAAEGEYYWKGVSNPPTFYGASAAGYATDESDPRWLNSTQAVHNESGIRSCKDMPNINEATWYMFNGDPRWETGMAWCLNGNYTHMYSTGAWVLKKQFIPGFSASITAPDPYNNGIQYNGIEDEGVGGNEYMCDSTSYQTKGRPSSTEISKYFFLPACGRLEEGTYAVSPGRAGVYWLSSRVGNFNKAANRWAYRLYFNENRMNVAINYRAWGNIVAPDWFQ